jgi:hypothetical protein
MNRMFSPEEHKRIAQIQRQEARRRQLVLWAPPLIIASVCALVSVTGILVLLRSVNDFLLASPAKGGVVFFDLKTTVSMVIAVAVFASTFALSARIIAKKKPRGTVGGKHG